MIELKHTSFCLCLAISRDKRIIIHVHLLGALRVAEQLEFVTRLNRSKELLFTYILLFTPMNRVESEAMIFASFVVNIIIQQKSTCLI